MKSEARPITKDLVAQHGLTDEEYKKILDILGREPNHTQLGMFSVMWSEPFFSPRERDENDGSSPK